MTALRILHVLSACVWVGGTVALVFIGVPAIRQLEGEARATAMRALGRRWRPIGWRAMAVALISRDASATATRRRLVLVGWFNFGLTIAVPALGAVVLSTLD